MVGTVCLLETSRHGLLETELLQMLAEESLLIPTNYIEGEDEIATSTQDSQAGRAFFGVGLPLRLCSDKGLKLEMSANTLFTAFSISTSTC